MKIIEQDEFFQKFKTAWTFDEWLQSFEKPEMKNRTLLHLQSSQFLIKEIKKGLHEIDYKIHLLAIVADWCGDCHRNAPILSHFRSHPMIELKFLKKEDNLDLIRRTNGGEKIPYVMVYSQDGFFIDCWTERPYEAYKLAKEVFQRFNYEKSEELFKYYSQRLSKNSKKLYKATASELIDIILKSNAIQSTSPRINTSKE